MNTGTKALLGLTAAGAAAATMLGRSRRTHQLQNMQTEMSDALHNAARSGKLPLATPTGVYGPDGMAGVAIDVDGDTVEFVVSRTGEVSQLWLDSWPHQVALDAEDLSDQDRALLTAATPDLSELAPRPQMRRAPAVSPQGPALYDDGVLDAEFDDDDLGDFGDDFENFEDDPPTEDIDLNPDDAEVRARAPRPPRQPVMSAQRRERGSSMLVPPPHPQGPPPR